MRGTEGVVEDGVEGDDAGLAPAERLAGVGVRVPAREAATRHRDANPVAGFEKVAGRPAVDLETLDLIGRQELGRLDRVAIAPAEDAVGDVPREAVRGHVADPNDPV